jgi:hypothetical protein
MLLWHMQYYRYISIYWISLFEQRKSDKKKWPDRIRFAFRDSVRLKLLPQTIFACAIYIYMHIYRYVWLSEPNDPIAAKTWHSYC